MNEMLNRIEPFIQKKQKINNDSKSDYIISIPDLLIEIAQFLNKKDKAKLRIICKKWNSIITNSHLVWKGEWLKKITVKTTKVWYHRKDLPKNFCKCDQNMIFDDGKAPHAVHRSHYYFELIFTYDKFLLEKVKGKYFKACLLHSICKRCRKDKVKHVPFLLDLN